MSTPSPADIDKQVAARLYETLTTSQKPREIVAAARALMALRQLASTQGGETARDALLEAEAADERFTSSAAETAADEMPDGPAPVQQRRPR
jgi:hypothetical protein